MDKFLEKYNIPKLTYEEAENLSSLRAIEEIEFIKNLPTM